MEDATDETCVLACEMATPVGSQSVIWGLLINRAMDILERASDLIDW